MTINKHSLEKAGFAKVTGGSVGYRYYEPHDEKAAKRTPLIAVHGGPGSCHASMYDAMNALADHRPVLFYDQLGSYFSPADMTPELMTVERFVEEPVRLMDELSIDKAIFLGHSWGGVIVTEFALKHPDKIDGLILSSPLLSTQRWVDDCNALLQAFPKDIQDTIQRCQQEGTTDSDEYKAADDIFSKRHYLRCENPPPSVERNQKRTNKDVYNAMWGPSEFSHSGTLGHVDLFPRMHEISVPTLLITGEHDTATPAYMKEVQNEIKNASVSIIPDSGHASYVDNNKAYLGAIESFFAKTFGIKPARDQSPDGPKQTL